ncbi:MAG: ImmA/IrrE family metallo-endopeptidase [Acidobacteriota bacterium]
MARAGSQSLPGLLPATRLGRQFERKAIRIRQFAGVGYLEPLDPFQLAAKVKLRVISLEDLAALSTEARDHLTRVDRDAWSGGATPVLPDGSRLVILNPTHSRRRHSATLMEEICHVLLGHKADRIGAHSTGGAARDYESERECEAYGVGAAALLPYHAVNEWLNRGKGSREIANRYGVSKALVEYRAKIVGLWTKLKELPEFD